MTDFGSGRDLRVLRWKWSPHSTSGSELGVKPVSLPEILSSSSSVPLPLILALSLSKMKKKKKKKTLRADLNVEIIDVHG